MPNPSRAAALTTSIDLVAITPADGGLAVLMQRGRGSAALPWTTPTRGETLDAAARRLVRHALGPSLGRRAWIEQVVAVRDGQPHPAHSAMSVAYLALAPSGTRPAGTDGVWNPVSHLRVLTARQQGLARAAVSFLRRSVDAAPVAFQLLPPTFTLTELQMIYELLVERRLHKASFRRALEGAALVEPIEEWRSEGRGRPAQLYRYMPARSARRARGVRFDVWQD